MSKKEQYVMRGMPEFIQGLENLISWIGQFKNVDDLTLLEIGSYAGESTVVFAKSFKEVLAIDPWVDNYDLTDITCDHLSLPEVEKHFDINVRNYSNIKKFKMKSNDFFKMKQIPKFDVVYIDGVHTYEQVAKDIETSKKFSPLIIAGHDYSNFWPGVVQAIEEKLGKPHQTFCDSSWAFRFSDLTK